MELLLLDLTDTPVAAEVLELGRRAYRVEAELIGSDRIPALRETLQELQASGETFLGARFGGPLAGVISWRIVGETIDLYRLVVDPTHFRTGVGTALVRAALGEAPHARLVTVQTGAANTPATALYLQEGFAPTGEAEPFPGLRIVRLEKRLR